MKKIAEINNVLTYEERDLMATAYEKAVEVRCAALLMRDQIEQNKSPEEIEAEVRSICLDILNLIDKQLIPAAETCESKVYYLTMKGDFYRHLIDFTSNFERDQVIEKSQAAYTEAQFDANSELIPTCLTRLRVSLKLSVSSSIAILRNTYDKFFLRTFTSKFSILPIVLLL